MNPVRSIRQLLRSFSSDKNPPARGFDFRAAAEVYANRLKNGWSRADPPPRASGPKIGVVVSPWLFTPAPFFMLELALQLRTAGHPVLILWDAGNVFVDAAKPRETAAIRPLLDLLPNWAEWLDIGTLPETSGEPPAFVEELLFENAVRHLRGEAGAAEFLAEHPEWRTGMTAHCLKISAFLREGGVSSMCIPGGVWASSGVWRTLCEQISLPYTTYDSGPGQVFVSQNSVAAHFGDIRPALISLLESGTDLDPIVDLSRKALQKRMEGRDPFALQQTARKSGGEQYDVLVPLNLRFDSAALCRQKLFHSITEWLNALLTWAQSRPDLTVAIRQHPCERLEAFRGKDSWEEILAPFLKPGGPVRFYAAEAEVNSYDLIENAKVVLPFTSRVGIEAAMMGKPVVTSASCYYDDCGFTVSPPTVEGYFAAVEESLKGGNIPGQNARLRAAIAYYLMEYCTALDCRFTPQPPDYKSWTHLTPQELAQDPELRMILEAASGTTPLTQLLHHRLQKANS